jgi:hypothetical protein
MKTGKESKRRTRVSTTLTTGMEAEMAVPTAMRGAKATYSLPVASLEGEGGGGRYGRGGDGGGRAGPWGVEARRGCSTSCHVTSCRGCSTSCHVTSCRGCSTSCHVTSCRGCSTPLAVCSACVALACPPHPHSSSGRSRTVEPAKEDAGQAVQRQQVDDEGVAAPRQHLAKDRGDGGRVER